MIKEIQPKCVFIQLKLYLENQNNKKKISSRLKITITVTADHFYLSLHMAPVVYYLNNLDIVKLRNHQFSSN